MFADGCPVTSQLITNEYGLIAVLPMIFLLLVYSSRVYRYKENWLHPSTDVPVFLCL